MEKIYALQLDGEDFEYSNYFDEDMAVSSDIYIGGNRDFNEMNSALVDSIGEALNNCYGDVDYIREFHSEDYTQEELEAETLKLLKYYFDGLCKKDLKLTNDQYDELLDLAYEYQKAIGKVDELEIICQVLTIVKCEKFVHGEITGSCQGDWNYYVCPESIQNFVANNVEAIYFATGAEFRIAILDSDEVDNTNIDDIINKINDSDNVYHDYTYLWKTEDVKGWLAKGASYGDKHFTKEDVIIIEIENTYIVKKYNYNIK